MTRPLSKHPQTQCEALAALLCYIAFQLSCCYGKREARTHSFKSVLAPTHNQLQWHLGFENGELNLLSKHIKLILLTFSIIRIFRMFFEIKGINQVSCSVLALLFSCVIYRYYHKKQYEITSTTPLSIRLLTLLAINQFNQL